jgi:quercetin dioxygenase-like cupin family protein
MPVVLGGLVASACLMGAACSAPAADTHARPATAPPSPPAASPAAPAEVARPTESVPAAAEPPAPIDSALPVSPPTELVRKAVCSKHECRLKEWLPEAEFAKTLPGGTDSPIATWMHELEAGSKVTLPKHSGLELLALVLKGTVVSKCADPYGKKFQQSIWEGFRAQGAGCKVTAVSDAQVLFVVLALKGTLTEQIEFAKREPWSVRWKVREGTWEMGDFAKVAVLSWMDDAVHVRLAFDDVNQKAASFGVMMASQDVGYDAHRHDAWENLAILSGGGKVRLDGKEHSIGPGSVLQIPPGTTHAFTASGDAELLAVQVFTPTGPERRYRDLAGKSAKAGEPVDAEGTTGPAAGQPASNGAKSK